VHRRTGSFSDEAGTTAVYRIAQPAQEPAVVDLGDTSAAGALAAISFIFLLLSLAHRCHHRL
jgi:hypothetical protein